MNTPGNPTETEYLALCDSIEREPTYGGLAHFIHNPSVLRDHCRELASQGLCTYPDVDAILNDSVAFARLHDSHEGYTESNSC